MAKILLGIALVIMLATAGLGFVTKGKIDEIKTNLTSTKSSLVRTEGTLTATKGELKKTQEDLTAANGKIEEKEKEIATQKGQMDDLNKKIAEATTSMEAKTTELAAKIKEFEDYKTANGGRPMVEGANPAMDLLKAEVAKAQAELAESKSLVDALGQQKKKVEEEVAVLATYKKSREASQMRLGTQGRILAVNGGWNFVVLSIGDKQGAVMNATMLVVRGGEPIAKVRISSVEPSTSIADIIPGSVRRGVTVQPGDNVVYEGRAAATTMPPSASAPGGGAPALPVR